MTHREKYLRAEWRKSLPIEIQKKFNALDDLQAVVHMKTNAMRTRQVAEWHSDKLAGEIKIHAGF